MKRSILFDALLFGLLLSFNVEAIPISIKDDPCVTEKILIAKSSPKKTNSTIISWVTVRSGGPINKDAPKCIEETPILEIGEPEFELFDPEVNPPEYFEIPPDELIYPPTFFYHYSPVFYGRPKHQPPAQGIPPKDVPEPGTLPLILVGFVIFLLNATFRRNGNEIQN